jgi:hypothetical protein
MTTHATRLRTPGATSVTEVMPTYATGLKTPGATSVTEVMPTYATGLRTPGATGVTEVMPPKAAAWAANSAANWAWVITLTELTGMTPSRQLAPPAET